MVCVYHSKDLNLMIRIEDEVVVKIDFVTLHSKVAKVGNSTRKTEDSTDDLVIEIFRELDEYQFHGRRNFDLPFRLIGTEFQMMVWKAVLSVPYGETLSYTEIAEMISKPRSVRAVANAIGDNPLPILIPCHRVIGKDGTLTGFGGGIPLKKYLLEVEQRWAEQS